MIPHSAGFRPEPVEPESVIELAKLEQDGRDPEQPAPGPDPAEYADLPDLARDGYGWPKVGGW